jgi:hypothetical protein
MDEITQQNASPAETASASRNSMEGQAAALLENIAGFLPRASKIYYTGADFTHPFA